MRETDLPEFQDVMARLGSVFGKRAADLENLAPSYFRALQRFDIVDVKRSAQVLIESEQYFPKPAQWIAAATTIPRGEALPELPADEAREWLDAERRGFEGVCCSCASCVAAGVSERETRYVPLDPPDRRALGQREVLRGHWAHGWELARWYEARGNFYEMGLRLQQGHPIRDLMETLWRVA